MLGDELPELVPQLRPYQRRAVFWMIQREQGLSASSVRTAENQLYSPFCVPLSFLDGTSQMFFNPFGGNISLRPETSLSHIPGGILADEMGLGKTVELLACIVIQRKLCPEDCTASDKEATETGNGIKRLKKERVECICGAVAENPQFKGLWVQCDSCDAWQHADCVGYSPRKQILSKSLLQGNNPRETDSTPVMKTNDSYLCPVCSELIAATNSLIYSRSTLIVCPSPILMQWHAELTRHTKPGVLKIHIYEGARALSPSSNLKAYVSELATSDIVLTTYDVLKEDLSHDSDRHVGDRRCMRFQKRYPVVPTLLTRIFWWRLCLDEAQMVESNASAVTEMALRLRAKHCWCITGTPIQKSLDDLYGLLRFLKARPFDIFKWWSEVIRDPYEKNDSVAMQFTHNFFKQIMWRSSKVHVSDELQLPPQEENASWLSFSPIEEHFYQKQHETCMKHALEAVERFKKDSVRPKSVADLNDFCDSILSHADAAKLLAPLLKLRQACCHPQVGGSGLRSLQQSPMTMDEILEVLISKAKIEGEEALRKVIVALNGLAAISFIEKDYKQTSSLYGEVLSISEKHSEDFRVDPLLSLHVHHNLADLLPLIPKHMKNSLDEGPRELLLEVTTPKFSGECVAKRQKLCEHISSDFVGPQDGTEKYCCPKPCGIDLSHGAKSDSVVKTKASSALFDDVFLKKKCKDITDKYLSIFLSKLSVARQEFLAGCAQVYDLSESFRDLNVNWWLEALCLIEKNEDSSDELIRKIDEAVSRTVNGARSSPVSSRYRSISGLKLIIQSGLDSLEIARQSLISRLSEIDKTMETPKETDILRVRFCPSCQSGNGSLCVHCELNGLFQEYEARLFHLKKGDYMVASAEEAINFQKKKSELNLFFRDGNNGVEHAAADFGKKGQRHGSTNVVIYKLPSDLELILGVLKRKSKSLLGGQGASSAGKHLLLFEAMRKEFAHARSLSTAQAQVLSAHDEIKMSTSRLRLRETDDEPTSINVLSRDQLLLSSMQFSSDKFLSLSLLERIKGQLCYLKGLAMPKSEGHGETNPLPETHGDQNSFTSGNYLKERTTQLSKEDDHLCPVCHEELTNKKMVFQCGHATCCKCCLELTERPLFLTFKSSKEWVMCPTCRQHTDAENIAYVDDTRSKAHNSKVPGTSQAERASESSIKVEGSYGTKIEAIMRRILWILSGDEGAKVLVFSSWNDVLNLLEHALQENHTNYVRMKGGRKAEAAIAQFKGYQSGINAVRVLLLLIQHGANGLNILEAQHVILVEPLLNPAAEAQAINRVHRIGQDKKTFVHRFMISGTVEESIYNLKPRSKNPSAVILNRSKGQDQPAFTLKDIETLLKPMPSKHTADGADELPTEESSQRLPPAAAAAMAAERRLMESSASSSVK
ncbi:RING-finger, DEAD-like helicase, PHD and SNF2 domain-containing protein isoform X2 [Wolffia australiana]